VSQSTNPDHPNSHKRLRRTDSTAILLAGARDGDAQALEYILERYVGRLRRWASGRLPYYARDSADTEDLVQDAIIQSVGKLGDMQLQWKGVFHSYLRQAVLNKIRDHIRRAGARDRAHDAVAPRGLPAQTSPLEEVIGLEALERYERALEQLSDGDRELVVARMEMDCGYEEMAELLGKPSADAVRMGVKRALSRLARAMEQEVTP
jgi:RNA polymerase sigma-70 factor (ECF subfamily)